MFIGIFGMMMFFMLSGAFRAAGDAEDAAAARRDHDGADDRVQRRPDPAVRHDRRSVRHDCEQHRSWRSTASWKLFTPGSVIHFHRGMDMRPTWTIIRSLFRFGLPTGVQGIAMNIAGVLLLRFVGSLEHSAAAQAAYAVGYTELFSLITWTSVGLMGASATMAGQNLGAGNPERAMHGVAVAARIGLGVAAIVGAAVPRDPAVPAGIFGMTDPLVTDTRPAAACAS